MRTAVLASVLFLVGSLAACGLAPGGTAGPVDGVDASEGPDARLAPDSGSDAPASPDASVAADAACSSTSLTCDGVCVTSCEGCAAGPSLCPSTRTCGHCDTCVGYELECFTCNGGAPVAFCSTRGNKCGLAPPAHCACTFGDPSGCPGKNQICSMQGRCLTCGEDGSANITCANGLVCVFDPQPGCTGS